MTELERHILNTISSRKVTGLELLDLFCPRPTEAEVKDALFDLIERGEVIEHSDGTLEVK